MTENMTAIHRMSTFVFPDKSSATQDESDSSLPDKIEAPSQNHASSFASGASSVTSVSGLATLPIDQESRYLGISMAAGATASSPVLPSVNRNSDDMELFNNNYSSTSINYIPESQSQLNPGDPLSSSFGSQTSPSTMPPQKPYQQAQRLFPNNSAVTSTAITETEDLFDPPSTATPIQDAYRCLTTPSALHPSSSMAATSESFQSRHSQRQASLSSPSKSYKQSSINQPPKPQGPFRKSQQLPSSLSTPLQSHLPSNISHSIQSPIPIETLIQLDIQYSSGNSNATDAAVRLIQLLIYNNIVNRLQASVQTLYVSLSEKFRSDPAKFASSYIQSTEFCSSLLKSNFSNRGSYFMSSLKPSNRKLLGSFVGLIKTSPSFICASLSTMNDADVSNFFISATSDPSEDLTTLHRGNALDIIFHSFFPPVAPASQRFDYFSFILAFIFDNYSSTERFDKLCLAIIERIVSLSSVNHLSSLENMLLGFLQNGHFLLSSTQSAFSVQPFHPSSNPVRLGSPIPNFMPATSSAPTSTYPSPEIPTATLATTATNVMVQPPSASDSNASFISLQRPTARPTTSATMQNHNSKASSNSFRLIDAEFETKRLEFLNDAVFELFTHLNNVSTEAIPAHLIHFSRLVITKVGSKSRKQAVNFIFFKYFFSKYIYSFFNSPESLGLASDYFISEKQRHRILITIFQTALFYAETIVYDRNSSAATISPEVRELILSIYKKFSVMVDNPADTDASASNFGLDNERPVDSTQTSADSTGGSKDSTGQILVLCPSDVLTLYMSLFPSYALQRKNSFASYNSGSAKPIQVERSTSSASGHTLNRSSSSSCYGYTHSGSAQSASGRNGSGSSGTYLPNESLPSLDEINMHFAEDGKSSKSTPIFGPEDELFEWNLNDIRVDIEPVAEELLKKFPYLQFRGPGAAQYLNTLRPQKLQHFRLPHAFSEKWQVFRMDEDNVANEINEESIVNKITPFQNLDGGPLKFSKTYDDPESSFTPEAHDDHSPSFFTEFEKSPIASGYRVYAEIVTRSLENFVSENSASVFNLRSSKSSLAPFQNSTNSSDAFSYITGRPEIGGANPTLNAQNFFSKDRHSFNGVPLNSPSSPTYLSTILTDAGHRALAAGNFLQGSEYLNAANALQKLLPSPSSLSYAPVSMEVNSYLIRCLKRDKEKKLRNITYRLNKCEEIFQPYYVFLQFSCNSCESMLSMLSDLRTKVWYITEVRTHSLWNRAKEVSHALNKGTSPLGSTETGDLPSSFSTFTRAHSLKRNSSTNSLSSSGAFSSFKRFTTGTKRDYQTKRQSMSHMSNSSLNDLMFAPLEFAGPDKLSDREAENTKKWLDGQQIQNFCTGEERIHRFSCEVDDLVKRVIGDAGGGRRNRGQSLLTSSVLFRNDLWKMIVEVEGLERSSNSKSTFYSTGNNHSSNFDPDADFSSRRRSTDCISIDWFNPSHTRSKTTSGNHSELSRSYSLRGHKSRKSSPNLIDMFASSLDLSSKRMSSETYFDTGLDRPSSSNDQYGHRRNRSLNEIASDAGSGTAHFSEIEDTGIPAFMDESNRQETDQKREELNQFVLDLQIRLTSLVYTDIGLDEWSEGE